MVEIFENSAFLASVADFVVGRIWGNAQELRNLQ